MFKKNNCFKKNNLWQLFLKTIFLNKKTVLKMNNKAKFRCFFDGACAPKNPYGHMGIGAVIQVINPVTNEYENLWTHTDYRTAGKGNSNNVAEYMAVKAVLTELINRGVYDADITIQGDSKLAIMQLKGEWRIKGGLYADVARETFELRRGFENLKFKWIPREMNAYADELSNAEFIKRNVKQFSN